MELLVSLVDENGEPTQRFDRQFAKLYDPPPPALSRTNAGPFVTTLIQSGQATLQVLHSGQFVLVISGQNGVTARARLPFLQVEDGLTKPFVTLMLKHTSGSASIEGSIPGEQEIEAGEEPDDDQQKGLLVQKLTLTHRARGLWVDLFISRPVKFWRYTSTLVVDADGSVTPRPTTTPLRPEQFVEVASSKIVPKPMPTMARAVASWLISHAGDLPPFRPLSAAIRKRISRALGAHIESRIREALGLEDGHLTLDKLTIDGEQAGFSGVIARIAFVPARRSTTPPPPRWEPIRRLSSHAHKTLVMEVKDTLLGRHVAQKSLVPEQRDGTNIKALREEFRVLKEIAHKNVVQAYDLSEESPHCCFTMELVEGANIVTELRRRQASHGNEYPAWLVLVRQLVEAVSHIHQCGMIHGDLTRQHVIVRRDDRVVLIDFGSAEYIGQRSRHDHVTEHYRDPSRKPGEIVNANWDWYAIGVMLGEAVEDVEHTDPGLAGLAQELVGADPTQRPGEEEIRKRLTMGPAPAVHAVPRAPFVGRARELLLLRKAYEDATGRSNASVHQPEVLVVGPSGVGKTALVDEFVGEFEGSGRTLVLRSRRRELETIPYSALVEIFEGIARYLEKQGDSALQLVPQANFGALTQLFPCLAPYNQEDATETSHPGKVSRTRAERAGQAAKTLLENIRRHIAVVLVIEDFQSGDSTSRQLLNAILAPPVKRNLLVIVTTRDRDHGGPDKRCVEVNQLSDNDAGELARRLLTHRHPDLTGTPALAAAVHHIVKEAAGNPLFVHWLVRDPPPESDWVPSGKDRIGGRIERVVESMNGTQERRLLELVCICNVELDVDTLARALDCDAAEVIGTGTRLQQAQLARFTKTRRLEPYHDRIRQVVRRLLGAILETRPQEVWSLHLRLAAALEGAEKDQYPEEILIGHLKSANDKKAAAERALADAKRAQNKGQRWKALRLYTIALDLLIPDDARPAEREDVSKDPDVGHLLTAFKSVPKNAVVGEPGNILEDLGDILAESGFAYRAARVYTAAADPGGLGVDPRCLRKAAEQYFASGETLKGRFCLNQGLGESGRRSLLRRTGDRFDQLPSAVPSWEPRDEADLARDALSRVDVLLAAALGAAFESHREAAVFCKRGRTLALALGEPTRVARAFAVTAMLHAVRTPGDKQVWQRFITASKSAAQSLQDERLHGYISMAEGYCAYHGESFDAATLAFEDAEKKLTTFAKPESDKPRSADANGAETIEAPPVCYVRIGLFLSLLHAGRYPELLDLHQRIYGHVERTRDQLSKEVLSSCVAMVRVLTSEKDRDDAWNALHRLPEQRSSAQAGNRSLAQWLRRRAVEERDLCGLWRIGVFSGKSVPSTPTPSPVVGATLPPPPQESPEKPPERPSIEHRLKPFLATATPPLGVLRSEQAWLYARVLVAEAMSGLNAPTTRHSAREQAKVLRAEKTEHAAAWAALIDAAVDTQENRPKQAMKKLADGLRHAESAGLRLCAATARWRLAHLNGSEDELAKAVSMMDAAQVLISEKLTWLLAPGFVFSDPRGSTDESD